LPRNRGYEEIVLGRLRGIGLRLGDDGSRSIAERLVEYCVEDSVLAAYEPSTQEVMVVRENVDDSNLDGLKLVLAHELVHRGQHVNHPHLFTRVDDIARELFAYLSQGDASLQGLLRRIDEIRPIMTLIESHANYVQAVLAQTHFPGARIESHFSLATLLLRVFGRPKTAQYTEAIPTVAAATTAGDIDSLYRSVSSVRR